MRSLGHSYFLTESVSLVSQQLTQRGINLDKDRKEFQYEGEYSVCQIMADHLRMVVYL